jgi:hypothetical protein
MMTVRNEDVVSGTLRIDGLSVAVASEKHNQKDSDFHHRDRINLTDYGSRRQPGGSPAPNRYDVLCAFDRDLRFVPDRDT